MNTDGCLASNAHNENCPSNYHLLITLQNELPVDAVHVVIVFCPNIQFIWCNQNWWSQTVSHL